MQKQIYDISVIGGGPVGLSLLAAIGSSKFYTSKNQKPFALVDQSKILSQIFNEGIINQRVISVSKSSQKFFKSIGVWELLQQDRFKAYNKIQIWESNGSGCINFAEDNLGYIIEYDNIVQALRQQITNQNMTDIYQPNEIKEYNQQEGQYLNIRLKEDIEFESKLLVGSDGNKSKVKEIAKIGTYGWSYNQMGIVCTLLTNNNNGKAFQKFLKNGLPLALLPLKDGMFSIVWTVNQDDYFYLMKLSEDQFIDEINYALQNNNIKQQGNFEIPPLVQKICNKRLSFPLQSLQSSRYISQRIALIGDAAHSIHPLAGQGMNMGINDSIILANTIIKNLRTGNDIGSLQALDEYESQAKLMNYTTGIGMEAIKILYESNQSQSFSYLRNLGANLIDQIQPIKDILQNQASYHVLAPQNFEWE